MNAFVFLETAIPGSENKLCHLTVGNEIPQHCNEMTQQGNEIPQHVNEIPQHFNEIPQHLN